MRDQSNEATVQVLLGDRATLVMSPHLDDAMLSASSVVLHHRCEVWTVFAGVPSPPQTTSWDISCGFRNSDETMRSRLDEDTAAFAGTPSTTRRFSAWEGAYADPERRAQDVRAIRADLTEWLTHNPQANVLIPIGAGLDVPPAWWQKAQSQLRVLTSKATPIHPGSTSDCPSTAGAGLEASHADEGITLHHVKADSNDQRATTGKAMGNALELSARTDTQVRHVVVSALFKAIESAKRLVQTAMHHEAQRRRRQVIGADGLAANPDHLLVRDLTLEIVQGFPEVHVIFWEDLPYLWHQSGDDSAARLGTAHLPPGVVMEPHVVSVDREEKHAHLSKYVSQMPVMDSRGRLLQPTTLPSHERFWCLSRE